MTAKKTTTKKSPAPLQDRLYFAYGANTNLESMAARCPAAIPVCKMDLAHYRLVFRGVADIIPAKGHNVVGALWRISRFCEEALDRFEGFPRMYGKIYGVVTLDGVEHDVMMYTMNDTTTFAAPYERYEQCLREGYEDFQIDPVQLDAAIKYSTTKKRAARPIASKWATAPAMSLFDD